MKFPGILIAATLAALTGLAAPAAGQDAPPPGQESTIKVFLDCSDGCDFDYVRQEVDYLDYVRDRRDADVHVLVTSAQTGTGGREYEFQYIGLGRFTGHRHSARYVSSGSDTSDERRQGFARLFSLGLTSYLLDSGVAEHLQVERVPGLGPPPTEASASGDKWNLWVFRIGSRVNLDGERSDSSRRFSGDFSANRTTDQWKFTVAGNGESNRNTFTLSDGREVASRSHYYDLRGVAVKSLGQSHWAVLGRASTGESTSNNYRRNSRVAGGLEYSVFPYSESTRRTLVIQYAAGLSRFRYIEPTLYAKLGETRPDQSLQGVLALRQPWGSASVSLEHVNLLDDFSKRRLEFDSNLDFRVFRGLTLSIGAEASSVHDQIYLPAGQATDEEVLLRQRRLATSYRYEFSVGFSYQFGSIFNNVVNPRWSR